MAQEHPGNAVYVAKDRKSGAEVSFDQWGRKLDSNGNVVWGDRQRAGDAGASPIQRREESQTVPQVPQGSAAIARPWTQGPSGPMTPVQRSTWDNSPVAPVQGAASAAGVSVARMGNNPNVLAPGGIDPTTGKPYPTASNGGWRAPSPQTWRGYPAGTSNFDTSMSPLPRQMQSYVPPTVDNNVLPPTPLGFPSVLPSNAFRDAAQNWGASGLPMPNNAQYDPYPTQQFSVYPTQRSTYNGAGLPMPNNQAFDPYW